MLTPCTIKPLFLCDFFNLRSVSFIIELIDWNSLVVEESNCLTMHLLENNQGMVCCYYFFATKKKTLNCSACLGLVGSVIH